MKLSIENISKATGAKIHSQPVAQFTGIGTDTRVDLTGQLFIALAGETYDAHRFLQQAVDKGATGLIVHENLEKIFPADRLPQILAKVSVFQVQDTLQALQDLAHATRLQSQAKVVGITGSNGKTTSKEFSAAVLSSKFQVHFPKGSFNNHWGVPLTLLAQPEKTEISLIEMGMNHAKEIQRLCEIAEPDIVVCSMVGRAHIEHFGTIQAIAAAKEEIYQFAKADAIRIYNLDNQLTHSMWERAQKQYPKAKKIITFSQNPSSGADICLQIKKLTMSSLQLVGSIAGVSIEAMVPVFGEHNLVNLMVAASIGYALGMSAHEIELALPRCRTNWGRNQLVHLQSGAELLFDGYNANPDSMKALIDNTKLLKNSGKKIAVLAQMLEMGEQSPQLHEELGEMAGQADFDVLWFYGADSAAFERGAKAVGFKNKLVISNTYEEVLASDVASVLKLDDVVVVKGSRGMKLERFVMACSPKDFSLNKE